MQRNATQRNATQRIATQLTHAVLDDDSAEVRLSMTQCSGHVLRLFAKRLSDEHALKLYPELLKRCTLARARAPARMLARINICTHVWMHITGRHGMSQHGMSRHITAQCVTAWHSKAGHCAAPHRTAPCARAHVHTPTCMHASVWAWAGLMTATTVCDVRCATR